jgi:O-antigen biosynthesis protein
MTSIVSPSITVIVCTRDRPVLLEQCLCALSRQTYPRFDVLVVDNAPMQPVQDICRRWGAAYVLAPLPGLSRARNVGARLAQGELLAFTDDDAVAEAGWLEALVEDFGDREVAAVSGWVRYMKAQGDSRAMSDEEATHQTTRVRRSFDQNTSSWFTLACFGGIGDGGNMVFRRKLIASVQPFDERLGRGRLLDGGDEHVLFASLIARGYRIAHNPEAIVRHPSPPTPELQRARRFSDLRSSIAYLMFIWGEFSTHRIDILRFLSRAVLRRIFATGAGQPAAAHLSRWQSLRAMLGGALVYWRASREWDVIQEGVRQEAIAPSLGLMKPHSTAR